MPDDPTSPPADPFARAIRDHHEGTRTEPLLQRDGAWVREHPIERFYFSAFDPAPDDPHVRALDGPLLTVGCGAGRHALALQERFPVVATDIDDTLVAVARDRGVADARVADMFSLPEQFASDRFRSVLSVGTQAGLAGSREGLREFLSDLGTVTDAAGTALVDFYDPEAIADPDAMLGYRSDPASGLATRVMWFEYEGDAGPVLWFRLFSPDRLREAAAATPWRVADVIRPGGDDDPRYMMVLAKDDADTIGG